MILFNPSKLNFCPLHPKDYFKEGTYIEIRNIWGKVLYRLEKKGNKFIMKNYTFVGEFDYIKIFRHKNPITDSFRVQLYCKNCGDALYTLTAKLPSLLIIDTDFYVTKDRV